jgi:hypothetical protein
MQTIREQNGMGSPSSGYLTHSAHPQALVTETQEKRLKIREFKSWSVCFATIVLLTGLLKVLKLGITMDSVTSILFLSSLCGLAYFIYRIMSLSRTPIRLNNPILHDLN